MNNSFSIKRHDTKLAVNVPAKRGVHNSIWLAKLCIAAMLSLTMGSALAAEPADPFAGDTWHAVKGSWPGTIEFDGKTKKVVLSPVGSDVIQATYSYTVKPTNSAAEKSRVKAKRFVAGTLKMRNTLGQVSLSEFTIEGKELTMKMQGGLQIEHYLRMTKAEEKAELLRMEKLVNEGKLKLPQ